MPRRSIPSQRVGGIPTWLASRRGDTVERGWDRTGVRRKSSFLRTGFFLWTDLLGCRLAKTAARQRKANYQTHQSSKKNSSTPFEKHKKHHRFHDFSVHGRFFYAIYAQKKSCKPAVSKQAKKNKEHKPGMKMHFLGVSQNVVHARQAPSSSIEPHQAPWNSIQTAFWDSPS